MKKTPLILSTISMIAVVALGMVTSCKGGSESKTETEAEEAESVSAQKGAIVFFDLDRVVNEYDMANDLRSVTETKIQSIQDEINRRAKKQQNEENSFQEKYDKGLLTRSTAEVQAQKLGEQRNSLQNFAAQKQQEMAEEQQVMMNQIGDAIKTFLDKYNEEKQFAMIIANTGDILPSPVASADSTLDITDEIITLLNEQYVKEKSKESKK